MMVHKEYLNIPLFTLQWKTNQLINRTDTSIMCVENLNCKLYMCWNICHVQFFGCCLSSTFKISSSRNLPLPSSLATKKYQASVWSCSYVWSENETQISATRTLLQAQLKHMLWRKSIKITWQIVSVLNFSR